MKMKQFPNEWTSVPGWHEGWDAAYYESMYGQDKCPCPYEDEDPLNAGWWDGYHAYWRALSDSNI